MCGIIGYCGKKPAVPVVLEALKCLEYRGYDSAGIASLCDGELLIRKDAGQVDEVIQKHNLADLPGNVAIGHTRWATHGAVTQFNAHPHSDCAGRVAVVHNGIIENSQELREELTSGRDTGLARRPTPRSSLTSLRMSSRTGIPWNRLC
jgi:glutamine---fructose-6-phosphate transaminase (isomerizing)